MDVKSLIPLLVQGSMMVVILGIGLQSRWSDLAFAVRNPRALVGGLVAVNLVVPAVAVILCMLLPVAPMTKVGLVIMAVSPLAPFAPGKMLKTGSDTSYVTGLYATLILASVVIVPLTAALLGNWFDRDVSVPVGVLAKMVLVTILAPLLLGMLISGLWEGARSWAKPLTIASYLILLPVILLVLYMQGGAILGLIGDGTLAVIVLTVAAGLAAGHLLGGPEPAHRMALAQAAATRHPGIAALIAHQHFDDPQVMLAIILFLLASVVVAGVYSAWARKRLAPQPA